VTVKKPDSSIRLCVDYKRVNALTALVPFYMPTIDEILERVGQATVMSTIDLNKGYYQVEMREEDVDKTAFVCHRGHFEFLRMPFGLKNAPAMFQKLTSRIFDTCAEYATSYIDDIVVFSTSWHMH